MAEVIYTPIIDGNKSVFIYISNVLKSSHSSLIQQWLESHTYIDGRCVSGREIPRQQLWFQKERHYFCSAWKSRYERWESQEHYPDILDKLSDQLSERIQPILKTHGYEVPGINSCLINKYRDGNDSIRAHRDTHLSFGETPIIIGYSIGSSRILRVKRLHNPDISKSLKVLKQSDEHIDFILESNSLFVMGGHSQKYFSHEIPKMEDCGERYSLTFREFLK